MRKHLIIALILLFSLSLSACNKPEMPTETSIVLPKQETEIIEEASMQITTSEPATTEKSTTQVVVSKEEKEENISTSTTNLPQITEENQHQNLNQPKIKLLLKMFQRQLNQLKKLRFSPQNKPLKSKK